MDAGFTLNKRIHARGGRGRKKDVEAKQKRADYIVWRDQQDAFRRDHPGEDHDGEGGGDAMSLMQTGASRAREKIVWKIARDVRTGAIVPTFNYDGNHRIGSRFTIGIFRDDPSTWRRYLALPSSVEFMANQLIVNAGLADSVARAMPMALKRARDTVVTLVNQALVGYAAYLTPYEMVGAALSLGAASSLHAPGRIPMLQLIISAMQLTPAQTLRVPVSHDFDTGVTRYKYVSSGEAAEQEGAPVEQYQHAAPQGRRQRRRQRGELRREINGSDSPLALPRPPKTSRTKRAEYAPGGLTLRWASANVQTLLPHQEDRSYAKNTMSLLRSKIALLETQFSENGLDVVGVQEGRSKASESKMGQYYRMLSAPQDQHGAHGVQIWVRKAAKLSVMRWNVVSTILMYVVLRLDNGATVVLLSAHAPHSGASRNVRDKFWNLIAVTVHELKAKYPYAHTRVAIDANGRVGSVPAWVQDAPQGDSTALVIGGAEPERENENGAALRLFCAQLGLAAENTFTEAGTTWRSTHGTQHRIDYTLIDVAARPRVSKCKVLKDIDLTFNASQDHSLVMLEEIVPPDQENAEKHKPPFRINKTALRDEAKRDAFQQKMWEFERNPETGVNQWLDDLNSFTKSAALECFGKPADCPVKPWISPQTWALVRCVAPCRRAMHAFREAIVAPALRGAWALWKIATLQSVPWPQRREDMESVAKTAIAECDIYRRGCARWFRQIRLLQNAARPTLEDDRRNFLDTIAMRANDALLDGDPKTGFALTKALGAAKSAPNTTLLKKDGSLTTCTNEEVQRWNEHYAEVFCGQLVDESAVRDAQRPTRQRGTSIDVGPVNTAAAFKRMRKNRGTGPDEIPIELHQAGGDATAVKYAEINQHVADTWQWPYQWCGGELKSAYKKKGDPRECDSSRGLLLADHSGKALVGIIKRTIDPIYEEKMPRDQYGGVRKRGTDIATHLVASAAAAAKLKSWCFFALFIDLVKAFDRIIRQIVFGWGELAEERRIPFLRSLNVSEKAAKWIKDYIDERGGVFEQWGVSESATGMARTLHEDAWFRVTGSEKVITSRTGGRQGCVMGATVFNSGYCVALDILHFRLKSHGILLRVKVPNEPFWKEQSAPRPDDNMQDVVDATFVDDECIILIASSPRTMEKAIDILLDTVIEVFGQSHLRINWLPGKTEAICILRGDGATAIRESWRQHDEQIAIPLGKYGVDGALRIVDSYKHLGTVVDKFGVSQGNAVARAKSALTAYMPLSFKVFGSRLIATAHKMYLYTALILSRLFFNVHITPVTHRDVKRLNAVYMRGLRQIAEKQRFGPHDNATDVEVRSQLNAPAIDAILMKARLRYLGRIQRLRPQVLTGLLHIQHAGKRLPWVEMIISDAARLVAMGIAPQGAGDLLTSAAAWANCMEDENAWKRLLDKIHFIESSCDRQAPSPAEDSPATRALTHRCKTCGDAFSTLKGLESHARRKHGDRMQVRRYVGSSVCPCCGVDFRQRSRTLAHLGDRRRPKCLQWTLEHAPRISQQLCEKLDKEDAEQRKAAQRQGHSHVLARLPARTAEGKIAGRPS